MSYNHAFAAHLHVLTWYSGTWKQPIWKLEKLMRRSSYRTSVTPSWTALTIAGQPTI